MRARTVSTLIVGSRATCPVGRPFATHTLTSSSGVRPLASSRWTRQVGGLDHAFHRPVRPQNNNKNTRFAAFEDADVASSAVDAAASVPAPDDPVVSVMFTLAVVALSVLTLGVAYLSISSFLDQRQEEEDRKKAGFGSSKKDGAQRQASSTSFDESAFQPAPGSSKKKRKAPKKKSDKGFGN